MISRLFDLFAARYEKKYFVEIWKSESFFHFFHFDWFQRLNETRSKGFLRNEENNRSETQSKIKIKCSGKLKGLAALGAVLGVILGAQKMAQLLRSSLPLGLHSKAAKRIQLLCLPLSLSLCLSFSVSHSSKHTHTHKPIHTHTHTHKHSHARTRTQLLHAVTEADALFLRLLLNHFKSIWSLSLSHFCSIVQLLSNSSLNFLFPSKAFPHREIEGEQSTQMSLSQN